jgi:hypothetical protein
LTVIKLTNSNIYLNKPLYAGMCILDISKLKMYEFHYEHIIPLYGSACKLLFTDTDSLCYHVFTDDVHRDMAQNLDEYDPSDYPCGQFLHSRTNAKVIGKFKDECNGEAVLEFCGLRAKMYSLQLPNNKEKKTAKGIQRGFVKKNIRHAEYRACILDEKPTTSKFCAIQSRKHELHTVEIRKAALSPYDDKRYLLNSSDSLSYGHVKISKGTKRQFL